MNASPDPNPQKVRVRSPLPRELADVYPRGTWHGNRKLLRRRRTVLLELPHAGHAHPNRRMDSSRYTGTPSATAKRHTPSGA